MHKLKEHVATGEGLGFAELGLPFVQNGGGMFEARLLFLLTGFMHGTPFQVDGLSVSSSLKSLNEVCFCFYFQNILLNS